MKTGYSVFVLMCAALASLAVLSGLSYGQVWWEDTGIKYDYDLSKIQILIILGNDFDYKEMMTVKGFWEKWGAKVDIAGIENNVQGHVWKLTEKGFDRSEQVIFNPNLQLSKVNLDTYKVIFIPGGGSPADLIEKAGTQVDQIIQQANQKGIILSAISQGPLVFARAGIIKGKRVTGTPEIMNDLEKAEGKYVVKVCVVDGNIVTGNWPYFETLAVKTAEKIIYPNGGGPSEKSLFETNAVLKNIKERRSMRKYQEKDVDISLVATLLWAAEWAPSANNGQPWKFVVVRNKDTRAKIVDLMMDKMKAYYEANQMSLDKMREYWMNIFSAPVLIFAFYDPAGIPQQEAWKDVQASWGMQAVSAACQNILLAAEALNLGSLWIGASLFLEDDIKTLLGVPKNVELVTTLAVGYKGQEVLPPVRKAFTEVVYSEKWPAQ